MLRGVNQEGGLDGQSPWFISILAGVGWSGLGSIIAALALVAAVHNASSAQREKREASIVLVKAILLMISQAARRLRRVQFRIADDAGDLSGITKTLDRVDEFRLPTAQALKAYLDAQAALAGLEAGTTEPRVARIILHEGCDALLLTLKGLNGKVARTEDVSLWGMMSEANALSLMGEIADGADGIAKSAQRSIDEPRMLDEPNYRVSNIRSVLGRMADFPGTGSLNALYTVLAPLAQSLELFRDPDRETADEAFAQDLAELRKRIARARAWRPGAPEADEERGWFGELRDRLVRRQRR